MDLDHFTPPLPVWSLALPRRYYSSDLVSSSALVHLVPPRVVQLVPTGVPGSVSGLVFLINHTDYYSESDHRYYLWSDYTAPMHSILHKQSVSISNPDSHAHITICAWFTEVLHNACMQSSVYFTPLAPMWRSLEFLRRRGWHVDTLHELFITDWI